LGEPCDVASGSRETYCETLSDRIRDGNKNDRNAACLCRKGFYGDGAASEQHIRALTYEMARTVSEPLGLTFPKPILDLQVRTVTPTVPG